MALTLKMWENSRKCVMLLSWQPNANWFENIFYEWRNVQISLHCNNKYLFPSVLFHSIENEE